MYVLIKGFMFILMLCLIEGLVRTETDDDFPHFMNDRDDSLVAKNNRIDAFPADFFQVLTELVVINLGENRFEKLLPGTFANLTRLRFLNISSNILTELPNDLFSDLVSVKCLNISWNQLTELPQDIFDEMMELSVISLSGNPLKSLPEGLFRNNKFLTIVRLRHLHQLTNLPNGFLSNLRILSNVSLSHCSLKSVPGDLFKGSTGLQSIALHDNNLESLPAKLFEDLTNLDTITLGDNRIKTLPDNIFNNLINLKKISLANNLLTTLPDNIFLSCTSLEDLLLAHNNIYEISRLTLNGLKNLRTLNMTHNSVSTIYGQMFVPLSRSNPLYHPHKNIFDFAKNGKQNGVLHAFDNCKKLESVDLSYNNITFMYNHWDNIPHVRHLDLSHNDIHSFSTNDLNLRGNRDLFLDLSYNKIKNFHFDNLEKHFPDEPESKITLHLYGNPIACDRSVYDLLQYFDGTIIEKVKEKLLIEIGPMKCLGSKLNENVLLSTINSQTFEFTPSEDEIIDYRNCPEKCELRKRVYGQRFIIDCSNRKLTAIPDNFCYSKEDNYRNVMNFSGNLIRDFSNFNPVTVNKRNILDLSFNQISKIPKNVLVKHRFKVLKLDHNQITSIERDLKWIIPLRVAKLYVGNNPWECECDIGYLQDVIQILDIGDTNDIKCFSDNEPVMEVSISMFCRNKLELILLYVTLGLAAFAAVSFLVLLTFHSSLRRRVITYLRNFWTFLRCSQKKKMELGKTYDVFISYSLVDEPFIVRKLVKELENPPYSFKICLHFRNWTSGTYITSNIATAILQSTKTLVFITPNFLVCDWGKLEFRAAFTVGVNESSSRVIVITYGVEFRDLDPELALYVSQVKHCLQWGDKDFWDKLIRALTYKTSRKHEFVVKYTRDLEEIETTQIID